MSAEDVLIGKKKTGFIEMNTHTLVSKKHLSKENHHGKPHTLLDCENDIVFRDDDNIAKDLANAIEKSDSIDSIKKRRDSNSIVSNPLFNIPICIPKIKLKKIFNMFYCFNSRPSAELISVYMSKYHIMRHIHNLDNSIFTY